MNLLIPNASAATSVQTGFTGTYYNFSTADVAATVYSSDPATEEAHSNALGVDIYNGTGFYPHQAQVTPGMVNQTLAGGLPTLTSLGQGYVHNIANWYNPSNEVLNRIDPFSTSGGLIDVASSWWPTRPSGDGNPDNYQGFFAAHWHGFFTDTPGISPDVVSAPSSITHNFTMGSDDDSWLFIDGSLIQGAGDLGGIHAYAKTSGSFSDTPGTHTIDIFYAERCEVQSGFDFTFDTQVYPDAYYTVTYNGNGATGTPPADSSSPYASGSTVNVLTGDGTLVNANLAFGGWSLTSGGAAITSFAITGNTTLYAIWTEAAPQTYTVTYDPNSTTATGSVPTDTSSPYVSGTTVTAQTGYGTLVNAGYTFGGWSLTSGGVAITSFPITGNTTLYAIWVPITTHAVTYDPNYPSTTGTGGVVPVDSSSYSSGAQVEVLGNTGSLSCTGSVFSGWSLTPTGEAISSFDMPASDVTLYAVWSTSPSGPSGPPASTSYTLTYVANIATFTGTPPTDPDSPYVSGAVVTVQTGDGTLAIPNYTFEGWTTTPTGNTAVSSFTITADTTLYAMWRFNGNNGGGNNNGGNNNGGGNNISSGSVATTPVAYPPTPAPPAPVVTAGVVPIVTPVVAPASAPTTNPVVKTIPSALPKTSTPYAVPDYLLIIFVAALIMCGAIWTRRVLCEKA